MKSTKVDMLTMPTRPKQLAIVAIILIVLLADIRAWSASQAGQSESPALIPISQQTLNEQYGLRVQLLAVTAAGGLIDLRLQIVDAEKAKAFLDDHANFPALRVGNDVILRTSEETVAAAQDIQIENGKSIFIMFSNTGNVIKPGDPVNIIFGDLQLETIQSK